MQKIILLFILYFLPLYHCYLNNFYYTNNFYKKNYLTLKSSFDNNNKCSNNKKIYDDYSKFLNPEKKIKYIDLNNTNNKNNITNELIYNHDNIVVLYNSNTKTIVENIRDILKY